MASSQNRGTSKILNKINLYEKMCQSNEILLAFDAVFRILDCVKDGSERIPGIKKNDIKFFLRERTSKAEL